MRKISVGIIGLGGIAERMLPKFLKHPKTDIIGVFDLDAKRMSAIKKRFEINAVSNSDELINDKKIDSIYLAVPPKDHNEIAIRIMKSNKHILCEKPMASTVREAMEMNEVALETGVVNALSFPLYYGFEYNRIKQLLKVKTLGTIKRVELSALYPSWPRPWQQNNWIDSRKEGGFAREVFTHFVQLIQASFGPIKQIYSNVEYPENQNKSEIGLIAHGKLENGAKVLFNGLTGVNQLGHINLTIFGSKGSVEFRNWRKLTVNTGQQNYVTSGDFKDKDNSVDAYYELINSFYETIEGKKDKLVTFKEGVQITQVIEKLLGNCD